MGQVTIYLDNETETRLNAIVGDLKVSKSKWISDLIRSKTAESWPESIIRMASSWKDLPLAEDIRESTGYDAKREQL
jgi:hypothetical protein